MSPWKSGTWLRQSPKIPLPLPAGAVTLLHGHVRWGPSSVTVTQGRSLGLPWPRGCARSRREDGGTEPKGWGAPTSLLALCFPASCAVCLCTISPGLRFYFTASSGTDICWVVLKTRWQRVTALAMSSARFLAAPSHFLRHKTGLHFAAPLREGKTRKGGCERLAQRPGGVKGEDFCDQGSHAPFQNQCLG